MKKLSVFTINFYQLYLSPILHQISGAKDICRFEVTCSQYAKDSISKFGVLKGTYLSLIRILKCQPFYSQI